jgi:hypothetical protein
VMASNRKPKHVTTTYLINKLCRMMWLLSELRLKSLGCKTKYYNLCYISSCWCKKGFWHFSADVSKTTSESSFTCKVLYQSLICWRTQNQSYKSPALPPSLCSTYTHHILPHLNENLKWFFKTFMIGRQSKSMINILDNFIAHFT